MDAPLDTPAPLPGFQPLTPFQNTALLHAARLSVALAREQIGAPRPGRVITWWRRLVTTPRRAPLESDLSTIAINALAPLRQVCQELPPESAQLVGVLCGQVILVECLRGAPAGVHQNSPGD
jgi:hypothetical protein